MVFKNVIYIMDEYNNINNESFLNGIITNDEIPPYFITDVNKILRVNSNSTGLEWSNETTQDGFKANQGDGTTNTSTNYDGFVFDSNETTGLFNYGVSNESLGLRITGNPIIECESDKIYLNQNIRLQNDSLLTSARLGFGINPSSFISGDSTNNNISFNTNLQEKLRITTTNILSKSRIKFDDGLITSIAEPHIYREGTFNVGISLDPTYGKIILNATSLITIAEFNRDRIDLKEPVIYRNPMCFPNLNIIIDSSYTVPAILSGNPIYYMKRGLVTNSDIIFPQPASGYNPRYEIYTDGNGNSSTFLCRLTTVSNDVLLLFNGARTLISPVINYTLTLNAHYIFQFVEDDNRWMLSRIA